MNTSWANVQRHVADEITLLCDQHHREKTGGLLPIEQVVAANEDPHNHKTGVSKPYDLHYAGSECEVVIGSNRFSAGLEEGGLVIPILIDSTALFGVVLLDGDFLLNIAFFDEYNEPILAIVNNQLVHSVEPWDIRLVGTNLVVRAAHGLISLDMTFEPPTRLVIERGRLLLNGAEVIVRPNYALVTNNRTLLSGNTMRNVPIGISIGPKPPGLGAGIAMNAPRGPSGAAEARKWAEEEMRKRTSEGSERPQ